MSTFTLFALFAADIIVLVVLSGTTLWLVNRRRNMGACQLVAASIPVVAAINLLVAYLMYRLIDDGSQQMQDAQKSVSMCVFLASLCITYLLIRRKLGASSNRAFLLTLGLLAAHVAWSLVIAMGIMRPVLIEAFVIPTAGVAPTFYGYHLQQSCDNCGYLVVASPVHRSFDGVAASPIPQAVTLICPNCGDFLTLPAGSRLASGERLLADKTRTPHRWDMLVFENPEARQIRYIKRVVGLPSERVQIVDGEVVINGKVATKVPSELGQPPVCDDLWFPLHDTRYIVKRMNPNGPRWMTGPRSDWRQAGAGWACEKSAEEPQQVLEYTGPIDSRLPYNQTTRSYHSWKPVGDVRLDLEVASLTGEAEAALEIRRIIGSQTVAFVIKPDSTAGIQIDEQEAKLVSLPNALAGSLMRVSVRDGKAMLYQNERLVAMTNVPTRPDQTSSMPCLVNITANKCSIQLDRIAIWRDIYFTTIGKMDDFSPAPGWVMLGDNTDQSKDSRFFGRIPEDHYVGVAGWRYLPLSRWHSF
ncbi:hypothetical protein HED60_08290 [Planctomycetales bacterium ZRK34]|nr:hypothetical protein HED60_08290 [Planctomycetales bacterium ZRK34]